MNDMMKLLDKKGDKMDDKEKAAKMSVIQDLIEQLSMMLQDDSMGMPMEQVTVAAPDEEGLEEGLEMAQDMVSDEEMVSSLMKKKMEDDEDEDDMM